MPLRTLSGLSAEGQAAYVAGVQQRMRAGLHHYRTLSPRPVREGLWLVGDSVFPGQSTLATALGGVRTAAALLGGLRG